MREQLREAVDRVIKLLAAGRYAEVEALTHGIRLKERDIARAIDDYGRQLVSPPESAFALMDVVEIQGAKPCQWSVTMPLWTQEEGRSDLSLTVTLTAENAGLKVELDDVHVL